MPAQFFAARGSEFSSSPHARAPARPAHSPIFRKRRRLGRTQTFCCDERQQRCWHRSSPPARSTRGPTNEHVERNRPSRSARRRRPGGCRVPRAAEIHRGAGRSHSFGGSVTRDAAAATASAAARGGSGRAASRRERSAAPPSRRRPPRPGRRRRGRGGGGVDGVVVHAGLRLAAEEVDDARLGVAHERLAGGGSARSSR